MSEPTLHEQLDAQHTEALLTNYSGDYEVWLEEKVAELEARLEQWEIEAEDNPKPLMRPMTKMEHSWMDAQAIIGQLEAKLEAIKQALKLADERQLGVQFYVRMALMAAQEDDLSKLPTQQKLTEEDMDLA